MKLSKQQCECLYGKAISSGTLILYVALAALGAGILKILSSKRGKVSFGGIHLSWGN